MKVMINGIEFPDLSFLISAELLTTPKFIGNIIIGRDCKLSFKTKNDSNIIVEFCCYENDFNIEDDRVVIDNGFTKTDKKEGINLTLEERKELLTERIREINNELRN